MWSGFLHGCPLINRVVCGFRPSFPYKPGHLVRFLGPVFPYKLDQLSSSLMQCGNSPPSDEVSSKEYVAGGSNQGMIIRCSSVIPKLKEAVFRCLACSFYSEPVMVDRGRVNEPYICQKEQCKASNSMTLVHN
jgi:hypothetical protein